MGEKTVDFERKGKSRRKKKFVYNKLNLLRGTISLSRIGHLLIQRPENNCFGKNAYNSAKSV